jgi:cytochrome c-type biogenesis protein CcmH
MSLFWILAAILIAGALFFVVLPLLGGTRSTRGSVREAQDKLDALKLLEGMGTLTAAQAQAQRESISAQLLQTVDGSTAGTAKGSYKTAAVLSLLLVVGAVGLYEAIGNPLALNSEALKALAAPNAAAGAEDSPHDPQDMEKAIAELRGKLSKTTSDVEGWLLLARSLNSVQRYDEQLDATTVAYELAPDSPEVLVEHAEALALGKFDRQLSGEPEKLLQAALKIEPNAQKAMWLTGIAAVQRGEPAKALEVWGRLKTLLEPGSNVLASLEEQMARAQAELAGAPAAPPAADAPTNTAAPTTTTAPAAAPSAATLEVTVSIDPALQAKVGPNDVLFVFARAENGPPMPLAIARQAAAGWPVTVTLNDENAMLPTMKLSLFDRIVVGARVSKSGNAMAQSGDFQILSAGFSHRDQASIALTINQIVP